MKDDLESLWDEARKALRTSNARTPDGDFKKILFISTCVTKSENRPDTQPEFSFDAEIPRSAINDLALSRRYDTNSRAEAAEFLRDLADLIEDESGNDEEDELVH